jgi:hypothetical protein
VGLWSSFVELIRPQVEKPKPDLWPAYKFGLDIQNDKLNHKAARPGAEPLAVTRDPKIDELLDPNRSGATWEALYEAEQRLAALMPDTEVKAEAVRRFLEADKLGVVSSKVLKDNFDAAQSDEDRQATFICLLDDLQFRYIKRGLDRRTRKSIGKRLNYLGMVLILPMVLALLYIFVYNQSPAVTRYHFIVVIYFGMIGAYLSRMYAFQGAADTLDYDALQSNFPLWSVFVRLIMGVIGAILMYLLIIGDLLGGNLFPSATIKELWTATPFDMPTPDFAKLLIWSTIAGFSERFIPDQFTNLTAKANNGATATPKV